MCGHDVPLYVAPQSQRKRTCCFYTDVDARSNIEFCLICGINGETSFERKALSLETLGVMCLVRVNPCEHLFPLLWIHSLLVFDSDACQCPAAMRLERNHMARMPEGVLTWVFLRPEWKHGLGLVALSHCIHYSTQPVKRLITDLKH